RVGQYLVELRPGRRFLLAGARRTGKHSAGGRSGRENKRTTTGRKVAGEHTLLARACFLAAALRQMPLLGDDNRIDQSPDLVVEHESWRFLHDSSSPGFAGTRQRWSIFCLTCASVPPRELFHLRGFICSWRAASELPVVQS